MDVTGPRLTEAPPPNPPLPGGGPPPPGQTHPGAPDAPAGGHPGDVTEPPPVALSEAPWVPRSTLKMALSSADVDARFEIDEETSRVTVTMYDRRSGEVLRQIPPEDLQEVIRVVAGRGMIVDVES